MMCTMACLIRHWLCVITIFESAHEKRDLMVFRFMVCQMRMWSPLFRLRTCVFTWSFLKVPSSCLRPAKALARLRALMRRLARAFPGRPYDKYPFLMCWLVYHEYSNTLSLCHICPYLTPCRCLHVAGWMANDVDIDKTPCTTVRYGTMASDMGPHCLHEQFG